MKPISYLFFFLFITCRFSYAQSEKILLRPENGKEYFYRFTDSEYIKDVEGNNLSVLRKQKTLHIKFSNVQPENKELLQVKVIQNKAEKPLSEPVLYTDYMYPYFEGAYFGNRYDNFYEELLCDIEFQYEFDFETSQVKLYNRTDVLLKVRETLKRKEFDEKGIERYTTEFNEKGIAEISKRLNSIYRIPKDFEPEINDGEKFKTTISVKDSFSNISAKAWDKNPGLYSLTLSNNLAEHYLKSYNRVDVDSLNRNRWWRWNSDKLTYHETDIRLLRIKDISNKHFVISGKIKNPKYKKITLAHLRNSLSTELYQEVAYLDENNTFNFETVLKHPELVLLQFGHTNQSRKLPILLIYAEPGSQIELADNGETFFENVVFSGDFSNAAQMLYEFRKKHKLDSFENLESLSTAWILQSEEYSEFDTVVKDYDTFLKQYRDEVDETALEFINKEMEAQFLIGGRYLINRSRYNELFNLNFSKSPEDDKEKTDISFIEDYVNTHPASQSYNEFGLYSRINMRVYLSQQVGKAAQIRKFYSSDQDNLIFITSHWWFHTEFPLSIEMSKVILGGHANYSLNADILQNQIANLDGKDSQNARYLQQKVDEYSDLMLRLCNNKEFLSEFRSLNASYKKWESADYIPETKFFNPKGEEVYFKDFLGEKPTVFFVANNWASERYYFDDLAKENPDINFVMVTEGSHFQEWADYMSRAEPVANQLLLINTEKSLKDIFLVNNGKHYIVYNKNGVRFAFTTNPLDAKNFARQSLETPQKKELNKSQLQLIILILLAILTTFVISIIIWKWRVRQRFRKEALARKLKESELTAIRSQMNPHFLFNSLNSVQNLVQQNKGREAHLYLSDFAGLIRKVLNNSEKEEVSLAEELEMIGQYLNLEKLRFDFEFEITVDAGIDQYNTLVPSILLQPFVENAVIHGLQNKPENRQLKVEVTKDQAHNSGSYIKITIEDNGIGRAAAKEISKQKNGKGTKLMKERLEILRERQGENYSISTFDLEEGTRVEIVLPEEY